MKTGTIYYLKKYHRPFITDKKENERAVIDHIGEYNNLILGHFIDEPGGKFMCCKHEFSKIFCSKPSKNNKIT